MTGNTKNKPRSISVFVCKWVHWKDFKSVSDAARALGVERSNLLARIRRAYKRTPIKVEYKESAE